MLPAWHIHWLLYLTEVEPEAEWGGTAGGTVLGPWDSRATVTIRVSL